VRIRWKTRAGPATLALGGILLSATVTAAATYSPPHADVFSFNYPNDSTGKSLPTRISGTNAYNKLKAMGYHAYDITEVSAATSINSSNAGSDAVWAHFGHGRPGAVLFHTSSGYSELKASSQVPNLVQSWPIANINTMTGLNDIRLMVFAECNSADSAVQSVTYPYGNLLYGAQDAGVDSALGFSGTIYWPMMNGWSTIFFQTLGQGYNVKDSAVNAASYVLYANGTYAGTDTYSILSSTKKIMPPAYGTP
jgi:hypothetical protein